MCTISGVGKPIRRATLSPSLHYISAIKKTKFGGKEAFVNPVMHAFQFPKFYRLSLEGGSTSINKQEIAADLERLWPAESP